MLQTDHVNDQDHPVVQAMLRNAISQKFKHAQRKNGGKGTFGIRLPKSRALTGTPDPFGLLVYPECLVRVCHVVLLLCVCCTNVWNDLSS